MRAVIDPGVYISAALSSQGAPAHLMRRWRLRQLDLVVCPALLAELDRTLRRHEFRRYIALDDVDALVEELERRAEPADDPTDVPPISRDPDDDYLVALAIEAEVDVLVSGDRDLLDLGNPPVRIVTPRALLDELESAPDS